jgi:membrane-bound serine protease (ClpP class)
LNLTPSIPVAALFLLAGVFLLSLELFVPSAGVLMVSALACILWSIVVAFQVHWVVGTVFLATIIGLAFVLPGIGLRIWRRTPMGRSMFLEPPKGDAEEPASPYEELVGEVGKALTPLRPSGSAEIRGKRTDVVADGGVMILEGEKIVVVSAAGNRIAVRRMAEREKETVQEPKVEQNKIEDFESIEDLDRLG